MSDYEDRVNELAEYITMHDNSVLPETVARYSVEATESIPSWYKGEKRRKALKEKSDALVWLKERAMYIGAGWSLEGDLDTITDELNKPSLPPPYPNYIMEKVRQHLGLESYDTSRDEEIGAMRPNNLLDACLEWEGIIGYGYTIRDWIKDIYGVTLE